jgi:hypothetical protein
MTIGDQDKIVSSKDMQGGKPGMWGSTILAGNEKCINEDVRQVARTSTMLIFDARSPMRRANVHVSMVMRHALLVDPDTGKLSTLVWLMTKDYEPTEDSLQLLPEGMREQRWLSFDLKKFTAFGQIPTAEAIALRQLPQGTAIPWTPELRKAGSVQKFDEESVRRAEQTLRVTALQVAPPK